MKSCVYDVNGIITSFYEGRVAKLFAMNYTGDLTLRISDPDPDLPEVEVGPCYPAGYNINGTSPIARLSPTQRLWTKAMENSPAQARAIIVSGMKSRCRSVMREYKDLLDDDFGDPDVLAEAIAKRGVLINIVQQATNSTSEAELRVAWNLMVAEIGGETV